MCQKQFCNVRIHTTNGQTDHKSYMADTAKAAGAT
jgi:hypothetical protein